MLEVVTLLVALGLLLLFNHLLVGDVRYPATLQVLVWGFTLVLYLLSGDRFLDLSDPVLLLIGLSVAAFTLGGVLTFRAMGGAAVLRQRSRPVQFQRLGSPQLVAVVVLTLLGAGGALIYSQQATAYALTGPTRDLAFNLRYLTSVQGEPPPLLMQLTGYALPLLNTVVGLGLIYFRMTRDRRMLLPLGLAFIAALAMSVFSSGRGIVLFLLIEVAVIYAMTRRRVGLRLMLVSVLTFLTVFYVGASLLGKGVSRDASLLQNLPSLFESLTGYLVSGTVALSVQLPYLQLDGGGRYVFRTFYAVANALGYEAQVVPLVQSYAYIPEPTNVYTMFLQYLRDFGFAGAIAFQFAFGLLHGAVYMAYLRTRRPLPLFWLSVLSFPLLTQAFTDSYFSLLTSWLQYLVLAFLLSQTLFRVEPQSGRGEAIKFNYTFPDSLGKRRSTSSSR
ncbi:O-antigen polymerase [Deinococcus sp. MIMF12]|uniref:O-antigen polymerase n=1 Tax=Deinococcus rhizophilus TaxID=3049544 RepID=A0ABT7JEX5_9DEIO|nr:O-antigen polymerase [Deinococcus rhizophilus]MDL2343605.1 O-antigen polymerase [Deinococcus rhizophilus]